MPDPIESSTRRIVYRAVLLLLPVVALAAATPWVLARLRPGAGRAAAEARRERPPTDEEIRAARRADDRLARAEEAWEGSTAIAPSDSVANASGERVRWFQGFGLSIESDPPGARVLVNGQDEGETPLTTSVDCTPGDVVRVEVRSPARGQGRTTPCRADQLVEMSFRLR